MKVENIQTVYGLNGFIMNNISFSSESVKIFYHRDRRRSMICPVCGRVMWKNRAVIREFYDLAMGPVPTVRVCIETAQGKCSKCGAYKTFPMKLRRALRRLKGSNILPIISAI